MCRDCRVLLFDGKNLRNRQQKSRFVGTHQKRRKANGFYDFLFPPLFFTSFSFPIPLGHGQLTHFTDSGRTQMFRTGQINFGFSHIPKIEFPQNPTSFPTDCVDNNRTRKNDLQCGFKCGIRQQRPGKSFREQNGRLNTCSNHPKSHAPFLVF